MIKLKQLAIKSLYKALLGTLFFIIAHIFFNYEYIRSNSTDFAFDVINEWWFSETKDLSDSKNTQAVVYFVDNEYLKSNNLLNESLDKDRYGYLLPRQYIADFINDVDKRSKKEGSPMALFIDFDMQFTSLPYNSTLSDDDVYFLNVLTENRDYPILLVKNSTSNFIEQISDKAKNEEEIKLAKKINELLEDEQIILVETSFIMPKDNIFRRYRPYKYYNEQIYYGFAVAGWQLAKNKTINEEEITNKFKEEIYKYEDRIYTGLSIIDTNILFKNSSLKCNKVDNINFTEKTSNWGNLNTYSANAINTDISDISNKIILFGFDSKVGNDYFTTSDDYTTNNSFVDELSGIQMHANALMTVLFLDGNLEVFDIYYSVIIVFILFFIIDLLIKILYHDMSAGTSFLLGLVITGVLFISLSIVLLSYEKVWFNWSFPILLMYAEEVYQFFKRYFIDRYKRKQNN